MFQTFGLPEMLVILAIILLLFGVGRVSRVEKELDRQSAPSARV
jgi:Sec-independent protein translocase protein TatA